MGEQRGSVLLLVPAGVLVLVILGALAVDAALAFLGQRALTHAAAAAANDVAAAAVSDAAFYRDGRVELDRSAATRVASEALSHRGWRGVEVIERSVEVAGDQVCVRVTGRVRYLFSPVVPGVDRSAVVHGRAVATAVVGDGTTASVPFARLDC